MTIASEANRSGPYACNGVTRQFPYEFRIYDEAHIRVILTVPDGTETTLALGSAYAVSGVGDSGGGAVEMATAYAAGHKVTLILNVPFTQDTDLENQGAYFAETIERAIDLQTQMSLQLKEQVGRAVVLPVTSSVSVDRLTSSVLALSEIQPQMLTLVPIAEDIETVAAIADAVVAAEGNAATAAAAAGVAVSKAAEAAASAEAAVVAADRAEGAAASVEGYVSYEDEQDLTPEQVARALGNLGLENLQNALTPFVFAATAGQTVFDLGMSPSPNACIVSQNGAWLVGGGFDYTIAGATLTLATPAEDGDRIVGVAIASFEVANALLPAANLADLGDAAIARGNLGLGSASMETAGAGANQLLKLDAGGKAALSVYPSGATIQRIIAENNARSTVTTTIPIDDTIPQITEGTQFMAEGITPKLIGSKIRVKFVGYAYVSTASWVTAALFLNGGTSAVGGAPIYSGGQYVSLMAFEYVHTVTDLTTLNFAVRVGPHNSATLTLNGTVLGNIVRSSLTLEEIAQ